MCVLGLHLAKELCEVDEDGDSWLQVTRRLPVLPSLLTALEVSLRVKQNLHFAEAALHLLLTLARTQQVRGQLEAKGPRLGAHCRPGLWLTFFPPQGATAVAGAGVTQSICLPLVSVYQLSSNGSGQVSDRPGESRPDLSALQGPCSPLPWCSHLPECSSLVGCTSPQSSGGSLTRDTSY